MPLALILRAHTTVPVIINVLMMKEETRIQILLAIVKKFYFPY